MRYAFVKEHQAIHSVRRICTLRAVSSAGYYEWLDRKPSDRSIENEQLLQVIVAIHDENRKTYGSPRIRAALLQSGKNVNRKRVARLMRNAAIQGVMRRRWQRTTDSNHKHPIAPNVLNREFSVKAIIICWIGDITYLSTG